MLETPSVQPQRPDPWRRMIFFSRFFSTFLVIGNFKSMGVFLPYFEDEFSSHAAAAGFVCSALMGFGNLSVGPFVGALMKVWTSRRIAIVGGLLACTCLIASSFTFTMAQLAVCIAISSMGSAMVKISSVKMLSDYYTDDFATANGVSITGGTIGMMALPPAIDYVVSLYGWRGALGLLGAFSLNYVVCGALLRPLKTTYSLLENSENDRQAVPMTSTSNPIQQFLKSLFDSFDANLLMKPIFILHQLLIFVLGTVCSMWMLFLIPLGVQMGFGESPSAFLATFGGSGCLLGQLTNGYLIDHGFINASALFLTSSLFLAASCLASPLAQFSYAILATFAVIEGFAVGVVIPTSYVLIRNVAKDRYGTAVGWLHLFYGAGNVLGGFFAGLIYDVTEDYTIVFATTGALSIAMAAILALIRCCSKHYETDDCQMRSEH